MKTLEQYQDDYDWGKYAVQTTYELIEQDKIQDVAYLFKACCKRAVKRGSYYLNDGGSMEIMSILFLKCKPSQARTVDRLFNEFFPRMHPAWYSHRTLWVTRLAMYKRLGWDATNLIQQFEARLLKGRFGQRAKKKYLEAKTKCSL